MSDVWSGLWNINNDFVLDTDNRIPINCLLDFHFHKYLIWCIQCCAWIMYSRKELSGLSRVSGQPAYRNVQQLAQEYRRMTSSRDNVSSSRGVRDPHASIESVTQFVHDKGPPKHAEPKEIRDATSPSKTYRQRHQGDDLYENARFYRKQAIYNWINSSEQVTQSQCCTA